MAGDDDEKGLSGAHTRSDPGGERGAEALDQAIAADLQRMAGELDELDEAQLDLLADSTGSDALMTAANIVAEPRRGRGRPKGSANKRSTEIFDYLDRLGHRCPAVTLSMIQTADTKRLASLLGAKPVDVLRVQEAAAARLMDFKFSKKPQAFTVDPGEKRPLMLIGDMNMTRIENAFLSVGDAPRKTQRNQGVVEAQPVRPDNEASDETDK